MSKATKAAAEAAAKNQESNNTATAPAAVPPTDTAPPVAPEAAPGETMPSQSSVTFAEKKQAKDPTIVTHNGKKYRINGRHFEINGTEYTDADLALPENQHIIDAWVVTNCGILREVFE